EPGKTTHQLLQVNGANIGAKAVAEIDEAILAGEIAVSDAPAVLVGQREGSADPRAFKRRTRSGCRRGTVTARQGRAESEEQACTKQLVANIHNIHHRASLAGVGAENQPLRRTAAPIDRGRSCLVTQSCVSLRSSCLPDSRYRPRRRSSATPTASCRPSRAAMATRRPG